MVVGILRIELAIPASNSLKDKRQVVRSLLDVARNRFNISAAETGLLDFHRRAELGFACVSNDKAVVNRILDKVLEHVESNPMAEVVDTSLDMV